MTGQFVAESLEMQKLDRVMMDDFGLLPEVLMERAGLGVAQVIRENFPPKDYQRVLILCGPGNNGGDGFVCARYLSEMGYQVFISLFSEKKKYKGEAKRNLTLAQKLGLPIKKINNLETLKNIFETFRSELVVDALFGTGLKRPISGLFAEAVEFINTLSSKNQIKVVAIDLPSGISADTGEVLGVAVEAHLTATFECFKHGLLNYPGKAYAGKVIVLPIGYAWTYLERANLLPKSRYLTIEYLGQIYRPRRGYYHKGRSGHLLILAGSKGKSGAGYLTALGALRAGAGLVTLACPESLQPIYASMLPEALTLALPEVNGEPSPKALGIILESLSNKKALAMGPGFGLSDEAFELLKSLLREINLPVVLDADALTLVAKNLPILEECKAPRILTPHPGEAARLLKKETQDILKGRKTSAVELAKLTASIVVLKGPHTLIATPEGGTFYSPFDVPGMAQGGIGDVLTGIIGSLLAQGYSPLESAILGVFLHGSSGEWLAKNLGPQGFTASEVANLLQNIYQSFEASYDRGPKI